MGSYLLTAANERLRGRAGAAVGEHAPKQGSGTTDSGAAEAPESQVPPATNGWLFKGGTRAMVAALGETFIPRLAAYPGPSLLVNGEDDLLFRSGEDAFLAAARDGRLEVIPGCGHLVSEDQPAAFNAAVRRFATGVFAPGVFKPGVFALDGAPDRPDRPGATGRRGRHSPRA